MAELAIQQTTSGAPWPKQEGKEGEKNLPVSVAEWQGWDSGLVALTSQILKAL
jgi:hypothetical protein